MDKSKNCFVISPIGAADSPQRKRADIVLKHIFKHALEPLGYTVVRADEISQPGSITLQVLERVLESDLVIADLTDHNPNVFYELAVRHASQKPVIHVIASDQKIPFDVADLRTIQIDVDLEGADRARQQIVAQATEIEAGNLGETPVKLAGVLKHLAAGKSDEKLILKQILDGISEFRSDLRKDVLKLTTSNEQIIKRLRHDKERDRNLIEQQRDTISLANKKLLIARNLEKHFESIGDSVHAVNAEPTSFEGDPYLDVTVTTTHGRKQSIAFPVGSSAEYIAKSLFDFILKMEKSTPKSDN